MNDQMMLRVGASRMVLEYPEGFFPHKSFRGRYFTGSHDDLRVRAIYLEHADVKALLISLELGDIGNQWLEDLSAATGVPAENIFLTVTHTHSAPHVHATIREDVIDQEQDDVFAAMCRDKTLACAKEAVQKARPARMDYVTGMCDMNCNRVYKCVGPEAPDVPYIQAHNPHGPSDKTLEIVRFTGEDGKAIAYLVNYPIHSIVTFYQTWTYEDSMLVSSDLAGNMTTYVEQRCDPDAVVMYTMSAAGDQIPKYIGNHRTFERNGKIGWEYYGRDASFALNDAQASAFGREVLYWMDMLQGSFQPADISVAHTTMHPMGKVEGWNMSETSFTEEVKADGNSYAAQYKEVAVKDFHYTPTQKLDVTMGLLKIGPLNFVLFPAELVCSLGAQIKQASEEILGGHSIVITQCNGAFSYICDSHGYEEKTFEAIASHFMPGVEHMLVESVREMAQKLKQ